MSQTPNYLINIDLNKYLCNICMIISSHSQRSDSIRDLCHDMRYFNGGRCKRCLEMPLDFKCREDKIKKNQPKKKL